MKKVYWRPQKTPAFAFVLVAMLSVAGIFSVEYFRIERRTPYYQEKVEASRLALLAMETIRSEKIKRGFTIDEQNDPTGSGLIGAFTSPVTSDPGNLQSKQTSIIPNCAAVGQFPPSVSTVALRLRPKRKSASSVGENVCV